MAEIYFYPEENKLRGHKLILKRLPWREKGWWNHTFNTKLPTKQQYRHTHTYIMTGKGVDCMYVMIKLLPKQSGYQKKSSLGYYCGWCGSERYEETTSIFICNLYILHIHAACLSYISGLRDYPQMKQSLAFLFGFGMINSLRQQCSSDNKSDSLVTRSHGY